MDTLAHPPSLDRSRCWHCQESIPADQTARLTHATLGVIGFCCQGCRAAFEIIDANGLLAFYHNRTAFSGRPDVSVTQRFAEFDRKDRQNQLSETTAEGDVDVQLMIEGIRCSACVWLIESRLNSAPGVKQFSLNPALGYARLIFNPASGQLSHLLTRINALGYQPHVIGSVDQITVQRREQRQLLKRLVVAGFGMMQIMMISIALYLSRRSGMDPVISEYLRLVCLLVSAPVVFYSGRTFFAGAWLALRAKQVSMDVSVSLGVLLAFFLSAFNTLTHQGEIYFESALMFIFLLLLSRLIEMSARHRAGSMAQALSQLLPNDVKRRSGTSLETVPLSALNLADEVVVKAHEIVPADGVIIAGQASVDEAWLTGEAQAIHKRCTDSVLGGSVLTEGELVICVTKLGSATLLAQVVKLLLRAQSARPKTVWIADQLARYFVAGVLLVTLMVAVLWAYLDPARLVDAVIAVLVISCPCALSLATPVVVAVAIQRLAQWGILVSTPDALSNLAEIDTVLLDKTGTLTQGKPSVHAIHLYDAAYQPTEVLAIAAALERGQAHVLAQAFRSDQELIATQVRHDIGQGVSGLVNGKPYRLGRLHYVLDQATSVADTANVYLSMQHKLIAAFDLGDNLREGVESLVTALKQLDLRLVILSGDQWAPVQSVAQRLTIDTFAARCTPADKLAYLTTLQAAGHRVLAIGDGINDAPLLQAADTSIAIGSGSTLAQAAAQLIVRTQSLQQITTAIRLARRMRVLIRQNLGWALLYNFTAMPLAAMGLIPPWLAAIGMSMSSLLVLCNAWRLRLDWAQATVQPAPQPRFTLQAERI